MFQNTLLTLVLVRGLPGSGKTTFARSLGSPHMFAADDYYTDENGVYTFVGEEIGRAHKQCQRNAERAMNNRESLVVVHNTFTQYREMKFYLETAQKHGYTVRVVHVETGLSDDRLSERGVHQVPVVAIMRMRDRWQPFAGEETVDGTSKRHRNSGAREG